MPGPFGMLNTDVTNFVLGKCRIYRPTGVTNTPLQLLGYIEKTKLAVKSSPVAIETALPRYTLKKYDIGFEAEISAADLKEVVAEANLDMFSGSPHSDVAAWAGAVLSSPYAAGAGTLVVTGDISTNVAAGMLCRITETGVGTEDFIAAKVAVATNTTITLPLGDTLLNSYTVAATVSRVAYTRNTIGKVEELTGGMGVLRFSGFQPTSGASYKEMVMVAHKMVLPRDLDLDFEDAKVLSTSAKFTLHADPSKPNGQQLGYVDVYTLTAP